MAHDHHHHDRSTYYLEQVFSIAVCGALAGVTILLWYYKQLSAMLHPKFHLWVLLGGVTLLAIVVIRAVAVWFSVEEPVAVPVGAHDHPHDHEHDHAHHHHHHGHEHAHGVCEHHHHGHDHGVTGKIPGEERLLGEHPDEHRHEHGHDHGHEHAWAPWRFVVLMLPVVLYFLIPTEALNAAYGIKVDAGQVDLPGKEVASKGDDFEVGFAQLEMATMRADQRAFLEGKTVRLIGQYEGSDNRQFTLVRYKMNCCAADAVPLNAVIMIDPKSDAKLPVKNLRKRWVQVTGQLRFLQLKDNGTYVPALIINPTTEHPLDQLIKVLPRVDNPFLT
jgi:hypothetical protein